MNKLFNVSPQPRMVGGKEMTGPGGMLPQWFQFVESYKLLLYGGLLFAMMRFSPDGLAGMGRGAVRLLARISHRAASESR